MQQSPHTRSDIRVVNVEDEEFTQEYRLDLDNPSILVLLSTCIIKQDQQKACFAMQTLSMYLSITTDS
jgi:hypothetical protein